MDPWMCVAIPAGIWIVVIAYILRQSPGKVSKSAKRHGEDIGEGP